MPTFGVWPGRALMVVLGLLLLLPSSLLLLLGAVALQMHWRAGMRLPLLLMLLLLLLPPPVVEELVVTARRLVVHGLVVTPWPDLLAARRPGPTLWHCGPC